MKNLLQNLFQNYSEEMQKLNSKLHVSTEKFKQLEKKMNRRYPQTEYFVFLNKIVEAFQYFYLSIFKL